VKPRRRGDRCWLPAAKGGLAVSDHSVRYGMIVLDAEPAILRAGGAPVLFRSREETVAYARLHNVQRWMVFGDPEGWWPLYTQAGPVHPLPPPRERVELSLRPADPGRPGCSQPPRWTERRAGPRPGRRWPGG
jgi:hypothetical protein